MADGIVINANVRVKKGNYDSGVFGVTGRSFGQTGTGVGGGLITATTAGVSLPTYGGTTEGFLLLYNHDTTNFVQFGSHDGSFRLLGKMKAEEPALLRLDPSVTVHVKADTANCVVEWRIVED